VGEIQLGSEKIAASTMNFSFTPIDLTAGATTALLVVADVGALVIDGEKLQVSLLSAESLVSVIPVGANKARTVAGTFPVLGSTLTLALSLGEPSLEIISMSQASALAGESDLVVFVTVTNRGGASLLLDNILLCFLR